MKVSVSLSDEDVEFLDEYAQSAGIPTRSAALQRAIRLLRSTALSSEYAEAWEEWERGGESEVWEAVVADGYRVKEAD